MPSDQQHGLRLFDRDYPRDGTVEESMKEQAEAELAARFIQGAVSNGRRVTADTDGGMLTFTVK